MGGRRGNNIISRDASDSEECFWIDSAKSNGSIQAAPGRVTVGLPLQGTGSRWGCHSQARGHGGGVTLGMGNRQWVLWSGNSTQLFLNWLLVHALLVQGLLKGSWYPRPALRRGGTSLPDPAGYASPQRPPWEPELGRSPAQASSLPLTFLRSGSAACGKEGAYSPRRALNPGCALELAEELFKLPGHPGLTQERDLIDPEEGGRGIFKAW